jgi:HTH-type transcriptional regulator / antitoxin HipB
METSDMKTYTLDELTDKYIGERGTPRREQFEYKLQVDILGEAIKQARKERNLTQAQLGELVGVQKAQISKLENSLTNARLETILKVFRALNLKIVFNLESLNESVQIA